MYFILITYFLFNTKDYNKMIHQLVIIYSFDRNPFKLKMSLTINK